VRRANLALSVLLASCAVPSEMPSASPGASAVPFYFPQHADPLGAGDAALIEGIPRVNGGCLVLDASDGSVVLPIWPANVHLGTINLQPAVFSQEQELLLETGDAFVDVARLGGSEATADQVAELVDEVPERCGVDRYWVVSDVLNRP
jgi:hypothetical protein